MRTKEFLLRFLPLALIELIVALVGWRLLETDFQEQLLFRQANLLEIQHTLFQTALDTTLGDTVILANDAGFHLSPLRKGLGGLRSLTQEMQAVSRQRRVYDQVRYLSATGMEIIRINKTPDGPIIAPKDQLQDKSGRYYFEKGICLPDHVYVSQFDLNMEQGKVEVPFKPMIRMVAQVKERDGHCLGVVVVNYLGKRLLDNLRGTISPELGKLYLVNDRGEWLIGPTEEDHWAFMFPERRHRSMGTAFPDEWKQIQQALVTATGPGGEKTVTTESANGLLSARSVRVLGEPGSDADLASPVGKAEESWLLILHASPEIMSSGWGPAIRMLVLAIVGITAMITWSWSGSIIHRRNAVRALRSSEERHRLLFENMTSGVALLEQMPSEHNAPPDFRFLNVNAAYEALTGDRNEDIAGKTLRQVFAERGQPDADAICARFMEVVTKGTPLQYEYNFTRRGLEYEVLAYRPEPGRCAVIMSDITERKQVESSLREAKDAAERASAVKSRFLANMSHEVRTPLHGILGILQFLQETATNEEQEEFILTAIRSATRLGDLLTNILELSKMDTGMVTLHPSPFAMTSNVPQILNEMFASMLKEKHLSMAIDIDERIPDVVMADATRLHQILFNLLGNAIKFTDTGGVTLEMLLVSPQGAAPYRVLFMVRDTGTGIPQEELPNIFQPFTQIDETLAKRHQGAGLGLAIVHRIVTLWGGELCVDTEPGEGTTIYVVLPFEEAEEDEAQPPGS